MYDSLLDELEDDVVSNPQEVEELTEKVVDAEEADAELLVEDGDTTVVPEGEIEAEVEAEVDTATEAEEGLTDDAARWIALVAGPRYDPRSGRLRLTDERQSSRAENARSCARMLTALVAEGKRKHPS